jgi:DNA-binding GntR family transcriptional regulator
VSPSHVLEPTYTAIKAGLVSSVWPAGQRLEANRIAEELGVSITPVRDSLSRLVGERLAELTPGDGFRVPMRSEQDLKDLLGFNLELLRLAVCQGSTALSFPPATNPDAASRIDALFEHLACRSDNREVHASMLSLNDRLHGTRRVDAAIGSDAPDEIAGLERLARSPSANRELLQALERYHLERIARAAIYVRHLGRGLGHAGTG